MNEVLLNRLHSLNGKKGLLKIAYAGEVAFTRRRSSSSPAVACCRETDEDAFQRAITESDFTVHFHEGHLLDGHSTMRVSGHYISAIDCERPQGLEGAMTNTLAGASRPRRVVILGAGASFHAGYPLAAVMGHDLAAWISTLPDDSEHHWCLQEIKRTYGTLDDFETILADLMTCPPGSIAESIGVSRPYVLSSLKEAIRGHFDTIRAKPTPLYDRLADLVSSARRRGYYF